MRGILQVADAKTGKEIYKARVGTGSATFSSSPLASAGKIYLLSEDGDTYVVEAGDEYREVAKNSLGEMSLATPAVDGESLYVRTATKLYQQCLLCGYETTGWTIDRRDRRLHLVSSQSSSAVSQR